MPRPTPPRPLRPLAPTAPPAPTLTAARLRHVGRVAPQSHWAMAAHRHPDFHELIVVLAARLEVRIADRLLAAGPGQVLLYPRGWLHAEAATGPIRLETLFLGFHLPHDLAGWPLLGADRHGRIQTLARWLLDLAVAREAPAAPLRRALLRAILHEYASAPAQTGGDLVRLVSRLAQGRMEHRLRLSDLAEVAGLSPCHFARTFALAAGEAPMSFVRRLRVEAARALILSTPLPLRTVAHRTGLRDESHLSRVFRRVLGCPPGSLRRPPQSALRGGPPR